jgi:hypothetical protein
MKFIENSSGRNESLIAPERSLCEVGERERSLCGVGRYPGFEQLAQRLLLQPSIAHLQLR